MPLFIGNGTSIMHQYGTPYGLYDPQYEHDACGVGFIARLDGKPSRAVVEDALTALKNLTHRGAAGARTGDRRIAARAGRI